jgi:hypothetical protein
MKLQKYTRGSGSPVSAPPWQYGTVLNQRAAPFHLPHPLAHPTHLIHVNPSFDLHVFPSAALQGKLSLTKRGFLEDDVAVLACNNVPHNLLEVAIVASGCKLTEAEGPILLIRF